MDNYGMNAKAIGGSMVGQGQREPLIVGQIARLEKEVARLGMVAEKLDVRLRSVCGGMPNKAGPLEKVPEPLPPMGESLRSLREQLSNTASLLESVLSALEI